MKHLITLVLALAAATAQAINPTTATAATAQPVRVACIGDSITYGSGTSDPATESYPSQLQTLLGDTYMVGNFGKPGATLLRKGHRPYTAQPEYTKALDFCPDIAIIHLGVNDTDPRDWPERRDDFVKDYLFIINSLREVNPDVEIYIAAITPITVAHPRFNSGTLLWQRQIRQTIGTVAEISGVKLIDFYSELHRHQDLISDAIHPDSRGTAILARTVYSAITGNFGGLRLPVTYSDNMIFQRGRPIPITGTADAGTAITVTLAGTSKKTRTGPDGNWKVVFDPIPASKNLTLTIKNGRTKVQFKNIAVGEVWLCSGQSNMEFPVKNMTGDNLSADNSIRLFSLRGRWPTDNSRWSDEAVSAVQSLDYFSPEGWFLADSASVSDFSAVAYAFGKMLSDSLKVPVGLICNAVGGSPAEAWIDREELEENFPLILRDWLKNDFVQPWVRKRASKNIDAPNSGFTRHPYEPGYLFEAGILPLDSFPIKGVIWYQGESNAHNFEAHEKLFPLLVESWRSYWNDEDLPFYYVQLSSLNRPSWPWFRDSQRRLMEVVPHSAMAVCTDIGDSLDVHPKNKKPVGERLARWALSQDYNFKIVPSGPLFKSAVMDEGRVVVEFNWAEGLTSSDGDRLRGFEVADYEGLYYPAEAEVVDGRIVLSSDFVLRPRYVRYAWAPFTDANLVNCAGLPASGFRSEILVNFEELHNSSFASPLACSSDK